MNVIGRCVKTGAQVLLQDYGRVVAADVFEAGDQLVVNFAAGDLYRVSCAPDEITPTHELYVGISGFYHQGKGVIVVPRDQFFDKLVG